jgi:hypothetical protein
MTGKQKPEFGSIFRHIILKGISAQVTSAAERVNAGIVVTRYLNLLVPVQYMEKLLLFDNGRNGLFA